VKKLFSLFLIAVLSIFALVACSNTAKGDQPQKPEVQKELSATDVLNKMIEKSKSQSYKMEGTIDQQIGKLNNKFSLTIEKNSNPVIVHIKTSFMGMELEMYVDNQFVYMNDPEQQKWVKMPVAGGDGPNDPIKQLEMIQSLISTLGAKKDIAKLEKTNGEYVVTLDLAKVASDQKVMQLVSQALKSNVDPQVEQEMQKALKQMKFDTLQYVYHVDANTFELKKYDSVLKAGIEGQAVDQKASFNVSKLAQSVTVPEEVKQAETVQP
jgi:hypothetical protein